MEHLSKQQIILLTLLVSFVTSIATGIVTVSLMDQAPVGVTQTINKVVEKTIERVVSDSGTAAVMSLEDATANAVEKVSKSIVRIKSLTGGMETVTGLGLIVSSEGIIVTDKASIAPLDNPVAIFNDGQQFPIQVIQSQIDGDIVFVLPLIPVEKKNNVIIPVGMSSSIKLGQALLSLSGKHTYSLSQGIYQGNSEDLINTSIGHDSSMIGSPIFTVSGEVLGFKTTSLMKEKSFYPLSALKEIIPRLSR